MCSTLNGYYCNFSYNKLVRVKGDIIMLLIYSSSIKRCTDPVTLLYYTFFFLNSHFSVDPML